MRSCNHEEADTRILVHVRDALDKGGRSVFVRTVDTDVLVILIAQFHTLSSIWSGLSFWVAFGMERIFSCFLLTPFVSIWASRNAVCFHFFQYLPAATLRQHSWGKERNLRGRPGKHTLKPQRLSVL